MTRINLQVYDDPGSLEVFRRYETRAGIFEWIACIVDTGAPVSLFPISFLAIIEHRLSETSRIEIEQAGIARQAFDAVEAYITIALEDATGAKSEPFEIRAWFADTGKALVGFDGVLDRAVLYANLRDGREAWLEID